ncbi:MAG: pentapeptide repeat-containing protein [Oscillospiraceae bacterium]|nr:pentapeptide repeat-containing protein [Oscillospiraceae bacterium]
MAWWQELLVGLAGVLVCVGVTWVAMVMMNWGKTLHGHVVLFMLGALLLGGCILTLLIVIIPYQKSDAESMSEWFNSIVTSAVTILGLATAGGAAAVGYRRQRSHEVTANVERLQKAIEHLGDDKPEIQRGAIYELKRLALDSKSDAEDVMDILRVFVLDKCKINTPTQPAEEEYAVEEYGELPPEVRLAFEHMAVIAREQQLIKKIDLSSIVLVGMNLHGMDFSWANLRGAHLERANLRGVHLEGANLGFAQLEGARLNWAHLEGVDLEGANLERADLEGVRLRKAHLEWAYLEGADLEGAHLEGTYLEGARLYKANLEAALFTGARLEGVHFHIAKVDRYTSFSDATINEHTDFTNVKNLRHAIGLPDWVLDKFDPIPEIPEAPETSETPEDIA